MISLKPGVRLLGLSPQMVFAHTVVAALWWEWGLGDLVVTSGAEGNHTNAPRPSGHYAGNALDYRTNDLPATETVIQDKLREALGPDFLVLGENGGTPEEHLHVEYLPRRVT